MANQIEELSGDQSESKKAVQEDIKNCSVDDG